jgi:hypothetical protein
MTAILAVDPGNEKSAWLEYVPGCPGFVGLCAIDDNEQLAQMLRQSRDFTAAEVLVIEMPKPRGMPTSYEEMLTCVWIGRFIEAWSGPWAFVHRLEEKLTVCGRSNATDSNIRQALIDRWGGKERAVGKKKSAGPLYGISNDLWQALAVAVTYCVREGLEPLELNELQMAFAGGSR